MRCSAKRAAYFPSFPDINGTGDLLHEVNDVPKVRDFSKRGDMIPVPERWSGESYQRHPVRRPMTSHDQTSVSKASCEVFPIESYDGSMVEWLATSSTSRTTRRSNANPLTYGMPFHRRALVREGISEIPRRRSTREIPIMLGGGEFIVNAPNA